MIQSSWGRVDVNSIILPTQNGQILAADLFKPKSVTEQNPAPLVVVVPGFQRSKESLSNLSIELSRRGISVICIDPYAQGASSSSMSRMAATDEGYGMFAVIDYVYNSGVLNYVDRNRIGVTGHSSGGNAALKGASKFGKIADSMGVESRINSVFISGYVLTLKKEILDPVRSNMGLSYALFDEGAFRNELGHADMRHAPEALRFVNSGKADLPFEDSVLIDHYYGNIEDRSFRVVHNEKVLHPFQPYDSICLANQIRFFENVFRWDSQIDPFDQVWKWKELFTLISFICSFFILLPLAQIFLKTAFFSSLVQNISDPLPRPQKNIKYFYWILILISGLVACVSYIPMAELSKALFVKASSRLQTWFFPQRMNNAIMLWAFLNGLIGMGLFYFGYNFLKNRKIIDIYMLGLDISKRNLLKTGFLSLIIFCCYYTLLFFIYFVFHVDYRFLFVGVRVFNPEMLFLLFMYVPFFFIFFLSNSLRVNGLMRFRNDNSFRSLVFGGFASTIGLIMILIVQYSVFMFTGTVFWDTSNHWLYVNLLFGVIPMIFILPAFNKSFFLITGRIYLGPITVCLIFIMVLLSNTVCYIPL